MLASHVRSTILRLRADNDVLFEYVAELAGRVIGHVMVSELTLNPDPGLLCGGIAPLSVLPAQQAAGVGSRLMEAVLAESRSIGLDALFLLGDPAYYQRVIYDGGNKRLPSRIFSSLRSQR